MIPFIHDPSSIQNSKELGKPFIGELSSFLNIFLSDIILRPQFGGALRIFCELELKVVEYAEGKIRQLEGRTDYAVGFAKGTDMFDNKFQTTFIWLLYKQKRAPDVTHIWPCIAQAASLYKVLVDAGNSNKCVWGIFSNAETWRFIFIDDGSLWQSGSQNMDLRNYTDSEVLKVYRTIHYFVSRCHEVCLHGS
ncbi:hypothetical protein HK098_007292 [Nowakowskiella sp. JEL0407]|nr:hypothetical protein HK098_007280 [Nowakowskiella sp. JEL0407]KAJ3126698.1 hypothetical protein HK098_007292 [Nowakowskiella sp. JEL0407]